MTNREYRRNRKRNDDKAQRNPDGHMEYVKHQHFETDKHQDQT